MSEGAKENFCSEHCFCLEMAFSETRAKQLVADLEKLDKSIREEVKKLVIPATIRFNIQRHIIKKGRWRLIASLDSIEDAGINEKDFCKAFPYIQSALEVLEKFNIKKYDVVTCTTFIFDSERFSPAGELILPTKLTLRPELIKRLGETELSGFYLKFQKSPLGLDVLRISIEDKRLEIRPTIKSELTTTKDLVKNTFIHTKEISLLFVEERK